MLGARQARHNEIISEEDFEACLREIELKERQEYHITEGDHSEEICRNCEEYRIQYDQYKVHVASVRVEAEMLEAELEGVEYLRVRMNDDEACIVAVEEVYSSMLLRRIRLIQSFTQYLANAKPVTSLRRIVCIKHLRELPALKLLEDVTTDLCMRIWRGDINYVPYLNRRRP